MLVLAYLGLPSGLAQVLALLAYTHLPLLEITKGELPSGEPDVAGFPSKHADDSKPGAARVRHCVASHRVSCMPSYQ